VLQEWLIEGRGSNPGVVDKIAKSLHVAAGTALSMYKPRQPVMKRSTTRQKHGCNNLGEYGQMTLIVRVDPLTKLLE
jgi:hypothetical protein